MAITDAERHRLHTKLDQVLGEEDAALLISHLPSSGWSDVARRSDLDQLEARLDLRFEAAEARMEARVAIAESRLEAALERNLREQANRFLLIVGVTVTLVTTVQALVGQLVAG